MNQPPPASHHRLAPPLVPDDEARTATDSDVDVHADSDRDSSTGNYRRPLWRLPPGVSAGTWEYSRRESIAKDYSDFIAGTPLVRFDTQVVLDALPTPKIDRGTRVVDFGCGDGRTLRALWRAGYDVLGLDLSQSMLRRVTDSDDGVDLARRLVRVNLVELSAIADQSADHGVCLFSTIGMIQGRRHRQQFLDHAWRLIRPGGRFVLHVHNRNSAWRDRPSAAAWLRSAWSQFRHRDHELGDRTYSYRGLGDMFLHTYSLGELHADLRRCGWRDTTIIPLSILGDGVLEYPAFLPSLRAGGFVAISDRP